MNKETPKRLGRPPGSLNKPKPASPSPASATHTLITIPKPLALKIASLSSKTGVHPDRIALAALVDGLNKWEGVHETLISYNESVDAIIRASAGPVRKRTRSSSAAPTFTVAAGQGDAVALEDTLGLQNDTAPRDNGADQPKTASTHITPDDNALFGRNPGAEGEGVDTHFDQYIHGE